MEIVILVAVAVAVLAVGIRMGMLVAPRVERMADRLAREAPTESVEPDVSAQPVQAHETPPRAVDKGDA